jgi:hypothetical protein
LVTNAGFAKNMYVGATNQSGQSWSFAVSCPTNNATNVTFAQFPAISTNGTLIFKSANYAFGTNQVTVTMTTSGSTTNGGVNSCTNTFALAVVQGQYPPAITGLTNKNMLENAITNLTMPFTVFDPLTTNFNITCTSANTNLLTVSVTGLGTNHTLVFAPVTNAFGTNTVTVTVDDGTLTNSATLTAGVAWVNQAPSFNLAIQSYIVDKYDVAVTLANAVTNIQAGPTNESSQLVTFVVTNNNSSLFLNQPTVSSLGTLIFTPGKVAGIVTVGIRAVDNGGALNGGTSNSASQTLTITIPPNPFNYLAGKFTGLFYDTNAISINSAGYFDLVMANDGTFTGFINNVGSSNGFSGQFSISNATMSVTTGDYVLNFTANTSANWTETVNGTVSNTVAGWNVPLASYQGGYSASFQTALAGTYLVAMPGFDDPADGPAGDSVFNLTITASGVVSYDGYLADNTYVAATNQLSVEGLCPVYVPLYNNANKGLLIGWLGFTNGVANSLDTNSVLTWINVAGTTTLYAGGFTNQAVPVASAYTVSASAAVPFSSGSVVLSGGNLATPITNSVTISDNVITVDPAATNGLSLYLNSGTGEITGWFVTPGSHTNYIESAILQDLNSCSGYFIGTNQGGLFIMDGN